jgi:polysaccharide deacetylase 2 family uncharacterized protein YibQ
MAKNKSTKFKTLKKRTKKKTKTSKSLIFYINIATYILIISLLIFFFIVVYLENNSDNNIRKNSFNKVKKLEKLTQNNNIVNYEEMTNELKVQYVDMPKIIQKKDSTKKNEFMFDDNKTITKPVKIKLNKKLLKSKINKIKKKPNLKSKLAIQKKPILAILIDDVTLKKQVNKILALPYDITMSFLPPTIIHKKSALIARDIKVAMIHLPLEASNRRHEEKDTLHIEDNFDKIDAKIASLKKLYPHVKYINNHTGSIFTKNNKAMNMLIRSLKKHNYYYVDSRTTSQTVIKKYAKKYNLKFLSRNIFLDNVQKKRYIQHQLAQVVKIAIKKGSAIAIGHPYNITIKTIAQSAHILKDVKVVYINKLKI